MSDLTPREKLADLIECAETEISANPTMTPPADRLATAILDAGWRPPARVVTTVEELDALPDMSVIRDAQDRVMRLCDGEFYEVGYEVDVWPTLPATVIYEPKAGE